MERELNDSDLLPGESLFSKACSKYGLDPERTSYVQLACAYLGEEAMTLAEIERRLGDDWTRKIVR
jgi:hypothetical protein